MKKSQKALFISGKKLFWKHGISRISVEELCSHAGISKMTFYRYYDNKYHLAREILLAEITEGVKHYDEIMHTSRPFKERFSDLMIYKALQAKMMSIELIQDLYLDNPENKNLRNFMQDQQEINFARLRNDLIDAQQRGEIRSDLRIDFLMHLLITFAQQMQNPQLLSQNETPVDVVKDFAQFFLHGIVEQRDR